MCAWSFFLLLSAFQGQSFRAPDHLIVIDWLLLLLSHTFYCMEARSRGEGTAHTGHVTTSNKGPVATHTHTGICRGSCLVVSPGALSLCRESPHLSLPPCSPETRIESIHAHVDNGPENLYCIGSMVATFVLARSINTAVWWAVPRGSV